MRVLRVTPKLQVQTWFSGEDRFRSNSSPTESTPRLPNEQNTALLRYLGRSEYTPSLID